MFLPYLVTASGETVAELTAAAVSSWSCRSEEVTAPADYAAPSALL